MMTLVAMPASFIVGMSTSVVFGFVVGIIISAPLGGSGNILAEFAVGAAMFAGLFLGAIRTMSAITESGYG